jgi:rubrerythrin
MYSWKSHQQHEEKVKDIGKYSEMFFSSVSGKIEGLNLDFYVCKVCGSTIDKVPDLPCVICNKPKSNYQKIERPVSLTP